MAMKLRVWRNNQLAAWQPNLWDIVALLLLFLLLAFLAWGAMQITTPYHVGESLPISLNPKHLPFYAMRTVLRLFIALAASLVFTFTIGAWAAKNKHAERFILPMVDILQSVPVLGFLSITVIGFIWLFPHSILGPECAAIFAIFTAQAWNMCLGFYQSLRTIPYELREATAMFHLSAWQKFWRVEVPFAMPSLIWNMMMSLSASWFFIIASEAITVNQQHILLPGIGSYIAVAIQHTNKQAIVYAIITMLIVILLYDQFLFRPLIQWSEKFKAEASDEDARSKSLLLSLLYRAHLLQRFGYLFGLLSDAIINFRATKEGTITSLTTKRKSRVSFILIILWYTLLTLGSLTIAAMLIHFIFTQVPAREVGRVIMLGVYTSIRIAILIVLCCIIWVPIGVWVGLRPRVAQIVQPIAQFLAAFPANLLFPVVFMLIIKYHLNVNIWTTPLMILGTQWYVLFNVIAGTTALPKDLLHVTKNLSVHRWLWWRRFMLPAIFPYIITGAITAAGGAWNASILAEFVYWGHTKLIAAGLGAYITQVTQSGDFPRIALGIGVMCIFVLLFNRIVWQPLYKMAEKKFQLD